MAETPDGILLIDKPAGWTSHDVVAKIRGGLKKQTGQKLKIGHTGTLDPLATGLMIIVVGSYCKRAHEFSKLDKTYAVSMKLGEASTTGDEEGQKTKVKSRKFDPVEIKRTLQQFLGEINQTPPIYSAIKIDGTRAYKLARAGKEVKLAPRMVKIHAIELTDYTYPFVSFTATVSSGTYIRSLVEDIGRQLGTAAYMSQLRRTTVGRFEVEKSLALNKVAIDEMIKV